MRDPAVYYGCDYASAHSDRESTTVDQLVRVAELAAARFPMNALLIRALLNLHVAYGDQFTVECPTGSGVRMTLFEVAREISDRLTRIFLPGEDGRRPCYGGQLIFTDDEHWRDLLTFNEYFHGDNGAGLGASHQTGWTGMVAVFPNLFANITGQDMLERGLVGGFRPSFRTAQP